MTLEKLERRAFGLVLTVILVLLVTMVPGAQANWKVEGAELTSNETLSVSAESPFSLAVSALNIEIRCTTAASAGLKLIAKSATSEGDINFTNCTAYSPVGSETSVKNCKPAEPITFSSRGLLVLHNNINYLLHEPKAGKTKLANIELPELCALAETSELTGSVVLECGHLNPPKTWLILDCKNQVAPRLFRVAPAALFISDQLSFGLNTAVVADVLRVDLSGARAGMNWGGDI